MYTLDKEKFGAFVCQLRKEKGLTQRELGEKLLLSAKAVSKWETGVNVPDTSLLIPLADILGVSVTELLMCERIEAEPMDAGQVEGIVKTAIAYREETPRRLWQERGGWGILYGASSLLGALGLLLNQLYGQITDHELIAVLFGVIFGAYFCFFARKQLPSYYEENKINGIHDGPFRFNLPGVRLNNRNWPHILKVGRIYGFLSAGVYPYITLGMRMLNPILWSNIEKPVFLAFILGGLFLPMYIVGKKYE